MADPMKSLAGHLKPAAVSERVFAISGIHVTVFGLSELLSPESEVACLWLLYPRLATQESMASIAKATICNWNDKKRETPTSKGLIAVSFDQRNHGTRMIDSLANEAWRQGNPRHAQDMFSIFQGTARDTSLLMDYLGAFIFPNDERKITENLVLGVSLGGHAAWSCLLHEPRVSGGVVIIGCPDYLNLMTDRARLSKLPSWTKSSPPGSQILGSEAFPRSFVDIVKQYDPASLLLSHIDCGTASLPVREGPLPHPTEKEQQATRPILTRCLAGRRIMSLSGGKDKVVPYSKGEVFLTWLKDAISPNGWFENGAVSFEDIVDENAGHEVTPRMAEEAVRFIVETLADSFVSNRKISLRNSKI